MASLPLETTRAAYRMAAEDEGAHGLADDDLLDRFLNGDGVQAEAAFQALVRRHGPMVLGVCRHILDQLPDAEDAFQATFLVLARKAGSIRDGRVLGRWLYEVAYRIAVRSRTNSSRRRSHERQGAEMSAVAAGPRNDPAWSELKPVLHEEVNRLPEKYRTAVVLCYLEGRTNEEAAALLRWPVGTVKGRLSRAREMLRQRLTRRGLTLSAAFLLVCLSQNSVFAEVVPSRLARTTVRTALLATRWNDLGGEPISRRVAELAEGEPADSRSFTWPVPVFAAVGLVAVIAGALLYVVKGGAVTGPTAPTAITPPEAPPVPTPVIYTAAPAGACHGE